MDTSTPTQDAPAAETPPPPAEHTFFRWMRAIGITRRSGWLGGVSAGVAARIGIDPVLVRGIVVVLAVLGAPVVLVYALAWLLLPDEHGTIHLQQLLRGRFSGAIAAIAAMLLLSFLPLTQGFWYVGAQYWGEPDLGATIGRVLWTAVVIALAVVVVLWIARRAQRGQTIVTVPATTDDQPDTIPTVPTGEPTEGVAARIATAAVAADPTGADTSSEPPPPADPPASGASDEELAAWTEQQQAWLRERARWAAEQKRLERARQQQHQLELARQRSAAYAERRRQWRLRNPRAGAAFVGATLGIAIAAGCVGVLLVAVAQPDRAITWAVGFGIATVVFGLALAIAGLARRRAGVLAFFAILTLATTLGTSVLASDRTFLPPGGGYGIDTTHSGRYARTSGTTEFILWSPGARASIDLWQRSGQVRILVPRGGTVHVIATAAQQPRLRSESATGEISTRELIPSTGKSPQGSVYDFSFGPAAVPDLTVHVRLDSGRLDVIDDPALDASSPDSEPTASPSPTVTEGVLP